MDDIVAADTNLQIRGNVIWNGAPDFRMGVEDAGQGCQPSNASCKAIQLTAGNRISARHSDFQRQAGF